MYQGTQNRICGGKVKKLGDVIKILEDSILSVV